MTKIKNKYSFTNNRQIWRLIPTDTNKIIIEDRNNKSREVFFNCLDILTGDIIFRNFQLDDKFWVGIETIYNDIIFFHKYLKPGLPIHTGIIAFDIHSKKIIWETEDYNFYFIINDKIYVFKNKFEGREYFTLDFKTGNKLEDLGNDSKSINISREEGENKKYFQEYLFPKPVELSLNNSFSDIIRDLKTERTIADKIDYIDLDNLLLISFHEVLQDGDLRNIFRIVEIESKKIILEEILDSKTKLLMPESFFIINKLVFLIKEKIKLIVYSF